MINRRIMYRNSYHGGDGWTYHPVTVTIGDNCPLCGEPRGEDFPYRFCEDGEWFTVSRWTNDCGHLDTYRAVWQEAQQLLDVAALKAAFRNWPSNGIVRVGVAEKVTA